ncbi:MAG: hypothetical protein H0T79_03885, partial [Deltaproteobacteria bacterium]|nr:hypothetical protein [Deltaproteobacteria bacterium]
RAAHAAAPALELPWPEWAQLLDHLAIDDALATQVRARGGVATIGYRRHDMEVELSGGWSVRLPGAFIGTWQDDEERYVATDGNRSIEFTSLAASSEHDSDGLLAVAPERHPVIARFADGARRGRAEGYDEDGVRVVHGLMTQAPNVAILTCKGDEPWALATWRSLVCTS